MIYRFLSCCATRWIVPSQRLRSTRTRVNALYSRRQYQQDHTDGPGINCTRHPWLGSHFFTRDELVWWGFSFSFRTQARKQPVNTTDCMTGQVMLYFWIYTDYRTLTGWLTYVARSDFMLRLHTKQYCSSCVVYCIGSDGKMQSPFLSGSARVIGRPLQWSIHRKPKQRGAI